MKTEIFTVIECKCEKIIVTVYERILRSIYHTRDDAKEKISAVSNHTGSSYSTGYTFVRKSLQSRTIRRCERDHVSICFFVQYEYLRRYYFYAL